MTAEEAANNRAGTGGKKKRKARYYTPPNVLRAKVGRGGFAKAAIAHAEALLVSGGGVDFVPHAAARLQVLERALAEAVRLPVADRKSIQAIINPLVDLKSGAIFGYDLISEIAAVALDFLECVEELNADGAEVVAAHQEALDVIVRNRIGGPRGAEGRELARELREACARYYRRHRMLVEP